MRRLAFVPFALLGLATAGLVSGAGGAVTVTAVVLASADSAGVEADAASFSPAISSDGRYVTFASDATNLAGVDPIPARTDIFVRDLQTGVTERITAGNGNSVTPSISDDGRWIAFESGATDLVPGDTNGCVDIFLYDRDTDTWVQVTEGNNNSGSAAVSGDGAFVAFGSFASDLVPLDNSTGDVFRWSRVAGTTVKVSVDGAGVDGNDLSSIPSISDDGSVIAFNSRATNLVPGDTNGSWDVIVRDVGAGTTEAASVSTAGVLASSSFFGSGEATISGNGRYVAFNGNAPNLVAGVSGGQVYLRDRTAGTTSHVSVGNGTSGGSIVGSVTDDGRVVFSSFASLVPDDTNSRTDVYLSEPFQRVSLTDELGQGTSPTSSGGASSPTMSADGSRVVVQNTLTNIIDGATTLPNLVAYTLGTTSTGSTSVGSTSVGSTAGGGTDTTPIPFLFAPPNVKLELTVEAAAPLTGSAYAPGELFRITYTVRNVGTDTAHGALTNDTLTILDADRRPVETTFPDARCAVVGPTEGATTIICSAGDLPPGASRTFHLLVRVHGKATVFGSAVARSEEAVTETQSHELTVDDGARACPARRTCESGAGTTTTTCAGESTVCRYGGEGVMNTVCRGGAVCGAGPSSELHLCTAGATCKDKSGEPNVFRCSGEGTYCAGIGTLTCTGGAFCRAWGTGSSATCTGGSKLDLRGTGNTARVNGCTASIADGNDVRVVGSGASRVRLLGAGDLIRTGTGRVFVDAINGEENVIDCNGAKSTVRVDGEDDPRDCEAVIGADVWVRPGVSSYGEDRFQGLFYVGNAGPADATNVRVRAQITLTGAELRSYRAAAVTPNRNGLSSHVVDTPEGAQLVIECLFPVIRKGSSELVQFLGTPTRRAEPVFLSVEARADEPDHVPENNSASREQDAKTFIGGKP